MIGNVTSEKLDAREKIINTMTLKGTKRDA